MKLHAIGIGNYRSIGNELVWINLEKKINIYIGANNSGKSNILKAISWIDNNKPLEKNIEQSEQHNRDAKNLLRIALKGSFEEADGISTLVNQEFILDFKTHDKEYEWLNGPINEFDTNDFIIINELMTKYFNQRYTETPHRDEYFKDTYKIYRRILSELIIELPSTCFIPQFRQITPGSDYAIDGQGIVELLDSWQHPEITFDKNYDRFLTIQNLLRRLLNLSDIEMEVVHTKNYIIVKNGKLRLPLESYGTGVHQLIILAVAVYSEDNVIFCIEEPEIHLHPQLQKEFLNFLINETNNKYLITTHSNALISPSKEVDVIHLKLVEGATKSRRVESSSIILDILHDLGIRPSDILQANSMIWVEGPSDRIYINKWIGLSFPKLQEGIDYSIMFYGGKLLYHLSLERDEFLNLDDLIPLLKINQNSIMIIDSDRKKHGAKISKTKLRVKKECKENNIYCWITDGKEIENYLPDHAISKVYNEITNLEINLSIGKYNDLEDLLETSFKRKWKKKWSYSAAKPFFARKIIQNIQPGDITPELKVHLNKIADVIIRNK